MKIVCLGDSLTEGDYGISGKRGIANVKNENYPLFLGETLGATTVNYGKCGYRASTFLNYYESGNVSLDGADVIIVMLGTNGGHSGDGESYENSCYGKLIEHCKKDAPNAFLVVCTPPHVTTDTKYSNCGYASQVKEAVTFVRKFASEKELPLIDLASCPLFTDETESLMQPNDGLHFGKEGYKALAGVIADELKRMLNI